MNKETEFSLDSRYKTKKEKEAEAILLMEERLKKMKNLSEKDTKNAKLVQLKIKMEDFSSGKDTNSNLFFSDFLKQYVDIIYKARSKFAKDLNITPISLSQIINNHREPKDEFLKRLIIHSEKVFESLCPFNGKMWYQIYFQEKLARTMSNESKWRAKEEKHVNISVGDAVN